MTLPKVEVKKILYATDLSESARYAFAYALSLANLYGARITFLHVLPEVSEFVDSHIIGYISADRWEEIKAQHSSEAREALIGKKRDSAAAKAVLDQFSEDAKLGQEGAGFIADEIIVERGNPVEQILKQAKERNCDLIVMGTHGRGTLADAMIGSTARRVLRRSEKPVLVVRLPEEK
ncbi:MAG: universal stress protein [Deltaproteobacteria bacterium]|nr:universal stress protein [Deltaproteobacteria bacterium]